MDAGCRMLDTGCWILDIGCWILDIGYWMEDRYLEFGNALYIDYCGNNIIANKKFSTFFGTGHSGIT